MKYITQFLCYIFELLLVNSIFFSIANYVHDKHFLEWIHDVTSYNFVEKSTVFFVFYQVAVITILTLKDSSRKDAVLAKMKILKLALVSIEHNKSFDDELKFVKDHFINNQSLLVNSRDKQDMGELVSVYEGLKEGKVIADEYEFYLKNKLVNFEHEYELFSLEWRLSFLLRILK